MLNLTDEGKTSQKITNDSACAVFIIHTHKRNISLKLGDYGISESLRFIIDKKYNFE
jgi:hypothetical protein